MKKILFTLCMCFVLCSCNSQFSIAYGVQLQGNSDGKIQVSFPKGSYSMDGEATIALHVGDSLPLGNVTTKAYILEYGSTQEIAALQTVSDSVTNQFNANATSGTYDLWLYGYVKETLTGLVFEIDRHWTNQNKAKKIKANNHDPYPYIK